MKIAIIVRKLNVKGGVQKHVLHLAKELKKIGHTVRLYTFAFSKKNCYPELLDDLEIISLGNLPQSLNIKFFGYFVGLWRELKFSKKLAKLIDQDTEILNPHDHVCYKVAHFFKRNVRNIPSVWMMHDMPTKNFSYFRAKAINPNLKLSFLKKLFYNLVDKYEIGFIKGQDKVMVLDGRDKDWVKKYFKKDATIVRNGVDLESLTFTKRNVIQNKKINILMNGIFMPHRRFEDGIKAVKILSDSGYDPYLNIVGDYKESNNYYKEIKDLIASLGLNDKVKFHGELADKEFINSYEENDIFIFPNHMQSWGLVVFEAMARGMPVIVSSSAGASEILTTKENAIIVNPKSPEEIASNIATLVKDKDLYLNISLKARKFVEKNISWANLANQMDGIFKTL